MNTSNWILALMLGLSACSAEPDSDEPLVVMWDDETEDSAAEDVGFAAEASADMGSADVATDDEPDVVIDEPDIPDEPEPTGNVCQSKDVPVQLINTCFFEWSSCDDGKTYGFECNIQNVAGNVFSLCNCFENGVMDEADKIVDICGASDWAEVEAIVNEQCGWDLR